MSPCSITLPCNCGPSLPLHSRHFSSAALPSASLQCIRSTFISFVQPWVNSSTTGPYPIRVPHNLHMDIYSRFIQNCQNLEAKEMPFSRWKRKLWYIQIKESYLELKANGLSSHENTRRNLECILLGKEANLERLYTVLTFWKKQKDRDRRMISNSRG